MKMNLLQYNVQSLNKNNHFLDFHLNKLSIDIFFLSEIFNYEDQNSSYNLINYNIISKKRSDNYGGVAIGFKKQFKVKKIPYNTNLDILICETINLSKNLTLVSVYSLLKIELEKLLVFLENKPNVLICGDFNARSKNFGDKCDTVRGSMVKQIFEDSIFKCLNDGDATFKKCLTDNSIGSVLDLSFTNSSLISSWKVLKTIIGGSHHFPILIKTEIDANTKYNFLAKKNC